MTLTLSSGDFIVDESALGRIVFVYETEAVTSLNQQRFEAAYQQWEALSNVDFRPRDGEGDYVLVRNTDRNRADVGYQGGERDLQMRAWTSNFTIMHEMAHTLGVRHEQSRPDRDIYVTINGDNVSETACGGNDCISNFNITADYAYPTGDHGLYDFGSIMHYGQFTFAVDDTIPTIYVNEPWTTAWQENIGQRSALSEWDEIEMGYIYPPGNWRFVDQNTSAGTNDGKFTTPYDDWNTAIAQTPVGGKLVVLYPDPYVAPGVYNRPMLIEAPLGAVIKGP